MRVKKKGANGRRAAGADDYHLSKIKITGFKSIEEQELELGRVNVFVGANGSGKSGLLEAIGVLGAAASGRVDDLELMRRGVRPGVLRLYKSAFPPRAPRVIVLEGASKAGSVYRATLDDPLAPGTPWAFHAESVKHGGKPIFTRGPSGANYWDLRGKKHPFKPRDRYRGLAASPSAYDARPEATNRLLRVLSEYVIYDPQTPMLRGTQPDMLQSDPLGLHGGRLAEAVAAIRDGDRLGGTPLELMGELLDWVADVTVSAPSPDLISPSIPVANEVVRFTDRYMRPDANDLSGYDASEGALFVLFAIAAVHHPRAPRLFALENLGHALHPRLGRAVVRLLVEGAKKTRRQLLLTTHNPLVLDALDLADDEVRLFTIDRRTDGRTSVRRVEWSAALAAAKSEKLPLSRLWVQGSLGGGVPSVW